MKQTPLTLLIRARLHSWVQALQLILLLVGILWCLALFNHLGGYHLNHFGIYPRRLDGLSGVLVWVLLHGDFTHLLVNSTPLVFLGFFVALRGPLLFFKITITVWLLAGFFVWLLAREAIHIGASGLVFGYFGFLLAVAVAERSLSDLAVASLIIFYYGGLFFGVLPTAEFVSWESHLFGLLTGFLAAKLFGKDWVQRQTR